MNGKTYFKINENHVEIYFEQIPDYRIRESLKICGWHWIKTKKCWSNYLSKENVSWAESLCKELTPKPESTLLKRNRFAFGMEDLIVRSNSFYCNLHHDMEDMAGVIDVRNSSGEIMEYLIPIVYCRKCNVYYILEETYLELKKKGVIMCPILSFKEYHNGGVTEVEPCKWNVVSPLRKWGYTVSQVEGYSDRQRQAILEDIVDCGAMSKDKVLSYLDFFIKLNQNKGNLALEKWKMDRAYIANYKLGTATKIKIGKITVIDYEYV